MDALLMVNAVIIGSFWAVAIYAHWALARKKAVTYVA